MYSCVPLERRLALLTSCRGEGSVAANAKEAKESCSRSVIQDHTLRIVKSVLLRGKLFVND